MQSTARRIGCLLLVLAVLGSMTQLAGCVNDATLFRPQSEDPGADAASTTHPERAIHLVCVTDGRAPDPGDVAAEPWKFRSETEYWIAECGDMYKQDHLSYPTLEIGPEGAGTSRQINLVRDGIQYMLQSDTGTGTGDPPPPWFNVLEYDADRPEPGMWGSEPLLLGDPDFYRKAYESGEASVVVEAPSASIDASQASETVTLVLERVESWDDRNGVTLTATVRTTDWMPIETLAEWWADTPADEYEGRHVTRRRFTHYEVAEVLAWNEIPAGTFELDIPPGIEHVVSRHLRWKEAAEMTDPRVYWLGGNRYESLECTTEPYIEANRWRHGHPSGGDIEIADLGRPLASPEATEVVVEYSGPGGPNIKVSSAPAPATNPGLIERWSFDPSSVETVSINGEDALLVRGHSMWTENSLSGGMGRAPSNVPAGTQTIDYAYVVLDFRDAQVIVQGWMISEQELLTAAAQVVPYEPE